MCSVLKRGIGTNSCVKTPYFVWVRQHVVVGRGGGKAEGSAFGTGGLCTRGVRDSVEKSDSPIFSKRTVSCKHTNYHPLGCENNRGLYYYRLPIGPGPRRPRRSLSTLRPRTRVLGRALGEWPQRGTSETGGGWEWIEETRKQNKGPFTSVPLWKRESVTPLIQ